MRISIFGMGYVGIVSGACLLRDGHEIVGVDPVEAKVDALRRGESTIHEPQVGEILAERRSCLWATTSPKEACAGADMVWVCVGTPSADDGGIDLASATNAIRQIGHALRNVSKPPLIVVRSTVLPGTCREILTPLLEESSGMEVGEDIDLVFHPEFLREGTAVHDFDRPPKIVVGECASGAADRLLSVYRCCEAPVFRVSLEEAEMVKYYDNIFHALKITFANEMGAVAQAAGVDARRVAEIFCADRKLNISPAYLQPGSAYGGSCLPKDLRAILRFGTIRSVPLPMLSGLQKSNEDQIRAMVARILRSGPRTVGMVGLAFKSGTDDMRESPYVTTVKALLGEGVQVRIYDPGVQPAHLLGRNKEQVQRELGHLEPLLVGSPEDLADADLVVVNHRIVGADVLFAWLQKGVRVLDLAGIQGIDTMHEGYEGIYW